MDRSQKEVKMSAISEEEWEKALTKILALLEHKEYDNLMESIPEICQPERKSKKFKSELPKTIIKHYGVNESIQKIKDAMDQIPRKDDEVQNLLRPFMAKLEKTDEPRSSQPQQERESHLWDIHAVLKELTASLAEQNAKMAYLEKENQEQAAKLKAVERQKAEIDQLKLQSKEQAAKLETEIEQLKQQLKVKQVAFSASQFDQGYGETGPSSTETTLIFRRVVTNTGNAYNPQTGIFTAPLRGIYHFEWHLYGHGNIAATGVLFRNREHIFIAHEVPTSGSVNPSNGASLLLEAGDQVSVRLQANSRISDNQNHHNTFSGHLIFTM